MTDDFRSKLRVSFSADRVFPIWVGIFYIAAIFVLERIAGFPSSPFGVFFGKFLDVSVFDPSSVIVVVLLIFIGSVVYAKCFLEGSFHVVFFVVFETAMASLLFFFLAYLVAVFIPSPGSVCPRDPTGRHFCGPINLHVFMLAAVFSVTKDASLALLRLWK